MRQTLLLLAVFGCESRVSLLKPSQTQLPGAALAVRGSPGTGVFVVGAGIGYHSSNGVDFQPLALDSHWGWTSIWISADEDVYLAGGNQVVRSTDGGATWSAPVT